MKLLGKRFFFRRRRFLISYRYWSEVLTLLLKLFQGTDFWILRLILLQIRLRIRRLWRSWNRYRSNRSIRSSRRWSRRRASRRWQRNCFWFGDVARCGNVNSRRDYCHLSQRILTTEIEDVSCGLDCATFLSLLSSELLLLHLEQLLFKLISFLLNESHLVLEQQLFVAVMFLKISYLVLQLLNLRLHGLGSLRLRQQAQLPFIVDILEASSLDCHILLSIHQIGSHSVVISVLPAQPGLIPLELLGMTVVPFLLIIHILTLGSNLGHCGIARN